MLKNSAIWSIALILSLVSGLSSLGAITKNKAPETAMAIWPLNGFASTNVAANSVKFQIGQNNGQFTNSVSPDAAVFAIRAFEIEPVNPEAIAVIALTKDGNVQRRLMKLAFDLSRREQLVTGWLIMDSGAQDSITSVLRYYDTVLRTNSSSDSLVVPLIVKALENEDFIEPLSIFLSQNPPWAGSFWRRVVAAPNSVYNAAVLRKATFKLGETEVVEKRDSELIGALVRGYEFETAEQLYALLAPSEKSEEIIRNSDFLSEPDYPPLNWQLISNGEYGASIGAGSLNLSATPNSGGIFARQIVKLPKQTMELSVATTRVIPPDVTLYVEISCAADIKNKPNLLKIKLREKAIAQKISNEKSACDYYWLSIVGRSQEGGNGFDVEIDKISLSPI